MTVLGTSTLMAPPRRLSWRLCCLAVVGATGVVSAAASDIGIASDGRQDLRSAYALHAPVHELCRDHLLPSQACEHLDHAHG